MRAYIRDGVLPRPGAVCGIESELFADNTAVAHAARRDDDIALVARELSRRFNIPKFGRV
jgi:hypothetical protein